MAQSARLRLQDLRSIHHIVGECRERGDSWSAWRSHLIARTLTLTGSGIGVEYEAIWKPGQTEPTVFGAVDGGWEAGFNRAGWDAIHAEFATRGSSYNPMFAPFLEALGRGGGPAMTRSELISNDAWYRSIYYRDHHVSLGGDASMYCIAPMLREECQSFMVLVREARGQDFSPRTRAILQELHGQIAPLIEGPLAGYNEPSPNDLAPRARQVLRCLLQGDSDKQIAARMGLKPSTVNTYVKLIYVRFAVGSRPELLARWIRRGWGLSPAWTDDDPV